MFQRAFTVGIGGPVGSGKTALVLALCRHLRDSHNVCVVTNDIFTRYIKSTGALISFEVGGRPY